MDAGVLATHVVLLVVMSNMTITASMTVEEIYYLVYQERRSVEDATHSVNLPVLVL